MAITQHVTQVSALFKLKMVLLYAVAYVVFYIFPNFHPLTDPKFLPLLPIDEMIPFLPWTFLIYMSDYVLVISILFLLKDYQVFQSFIRMTMGGFILCGLFFIFLPTQYPRPDYPVTGQVLVDMAMSLISKLDSPNNCFPSNHVFMTAIATWMLRSKGKVWFYSYSLWALAIFISTLTTKQHYFIDILGGLAIVLLMICLEARVFSRLPFPDLFKSLTS